MYSFTAYTGTQKAYLDYQIHEEHNKIVVTSFASSQSWMRFVLSITSVDRTLVWKKRETLRECCA